MIKSKVSLIGLIALFFVSCNNNVYLFTSFREPANEGLRMLYSKDGYHWKLTDSVLLKPEVGKDKIMRDPSMLQGPDGTFHLVWTTEWKGGNGFGYASSKDLVTWGEQQYIPVMKQEQTVINVWAPELFYDDVEKQYIIIWASTIPFRFDKGVEAEDNNQRIFYTVTKDFRTFSETKLFLDPKFSVIDAIIVKLSSQEYVLVLKDNTRPERNIRVAYAKNLLGPWKDFSIPLTEKYTEGPAVAKLKYGYLVYYDDYENKKFGASFTKDFKSFIKEDSLISVPDGHKHGSILKTKKNILKGLR